MSNSEHAANQFEPIDEAVELAQILNQSMDLTLTKRSPSYKKASAMFCNMANIAFAHRVWEPIFDGKFRAHITPEPYRELLDIASEVSSYPRQILRGKEVVADAQEANQQLQVKLQDAIGSLIGPPPADV